jgi:error-prone DNA polymerase
MLCRADTVGVFQIESRAQMATLPRLKPRRFYDLVVEVALIRPGPIQGGSVHPYIRRRNGQEPITYLHPLLENSLGKTLGVPLFQEQLMQMAIDVAGFSPAEADQLRQAMGSKRSRARMEGLKARLYEGMAERGIVGKVADQIFTKMAAFANYGFPESHSVSFSYLVYASAWIKYHEPAAFCAALLNAQPMGFWSPHSLAQDARRHGVVVHGPCINRSLGAATLEPCDNSVGGVAVRLGVGSVRGVGSELAVMVAERRPDGGYVSLEDVVRAVPELNLAHMEALATAGAFDALGLERREALWAVGAAVQSRVDRLPGIITGGGATGDDATSDGASAVGTTSTMSGAVRLPGMDPVEVAVADLWSTGVAATGHPTMFLRGALRRHGVSTAADLQTVPPSHVSGRLVHVAGVVTHRQRPMTAQGTTFMNLEDETGLINVVISKGCWARHRQVARDSPALLIRGRLERSEGVVNVVAESLTPLQVPAQAAMQHASRNFR